MPTEDRLVKMPVQGDEVYLPFHIIHWDKKSGKTERRGRAEMLLSSTRTTGFGHGWGSDSFYHNILPHALDLTFHQWGFKFREENSINFPSNIHREGSFLFPVGENFERTVGTSRRRIKKVISSQNRKSRTTQPSEKARKGSELGQNYQCVRCPSLATSIDSDCASIT